LLAEPTAVASSGVFYNSVFVNENPPNVPGSSNVVASYEIQPSGSPVLIGTYQTGHPGSDASFVASERADLALDTTQNGTTGHLYALNLGDSTISIFSVDTGTGVLALQTTQKLPLGATAIAVNPTGTVLYAEGSTNEGSADQLTSYPISANGVRSMTPKATVPADVDGITISPDGNQIATAYPGTNPSISPDVQLFANRRQRGSRRRIVPHPGDLPNRRTVRFD